jgi:hypothetical protein
MCANLNNDIAKIEFRSSKAFEDFLSNPPKNSRCVNTVEMWFKCANDHLSRLPPNLKRLLIDDCDELVDLHHLVELEELILGENFFPESKCSKPYANRYNRLHSIGHLPDSLKYVDISSTRILFNDHHLGDIPSTITGLCLNDMVDVDRFPVSGFPYLEALKVRHRIGNNYKRINLNIFPNLMYLEVPSRSDISNAEIPPTIEVIYHGDLYEDKPIDYGFR